MSEFKTPKEVLEKALIIWKYLEKTGYKSKDSAYYNLHLKYDYNWCPFCEYADEKSGDREMCECCLIWPTNKVGINFGCKDLNTSPYKAWVKVSKTDFLSIEEQCESKKHYAGEMVKLIKATIAELPKE